MTSQEFSVVSNAYGFAIGLFSLLTCAIGICRSHLPSRKIQVLETLLTQTENTFYSAIESGLLPDQTFKTKTEARLERLRQDTFQARAEAYAAITFYSDYKAFFCGLSFSIGRKCSNLRELRASVIIMSEKNRLGQNAVPGITTLEPQNAPRESGVLPSCGSTEDDTPLPAESVAESIYKPTRDPWKRPRSCPPDPQYHTTHPTSDCCLAEISRLKIARGPPHDRLRGYSHCHVLPTPENNSHR